MGRIGSALGVARFMAQGAYYTGVLLRDRARLSAGRLLEAQAGKTPARSALMFEERHYNYDALNQRSNRVAGALEALDARPGDVLGVWMENRPEYLFSIFGANKAGVVSSLINCQIRGRQLVHAVEACEPRWLLVGAELLPALEEVIDGLPLARESILIWSEGAPQKRPSRTRSFNDIFVTATTDNPAGTASRRTDEAMLYMYTSGTTGLPKAAVVTNQRYLRASLLFGRALLRLKASDVSYVPLPLYHATGNMAACGAAIATGSAIALSRRFSATHYWDDCHRYGATCAPYMGELCRYLLNTPQHPLERAHSLRVIFGAGLRPDVWTPFVERFHIPSVYEFYASTEGNVAMVNFEQRPGMLGKLMPGQEVVRIDPASETLIRTDAGQLQRAKPGDKGVLIGRIDRLNKFEGYLDRARTRDKVLEDPFGDGRNYFDTGDLVQLHDDRHVSFADRLGDTFRWKGENVSTTEVSESLNACPGVLESNVYGVEVPQHEGRAGMSALVVSEDFDLAAFATHVHRNLPGYARPCFLRIQPRMTLTGSFKYVKTELKQEGFDLDRVRDELHLLDRSAKRYVPLTAERHTLLREGGLRL